MMAEYSLSGVVSKESFPNLHRFSLAILHTGNRLLSRRVKGQSCYNHSSWACLDKIVDHHLHVILTAKIF
jgi:hypothetical protein